MSNGNHQEKGIKRCIPMPGYEARLVEASAVLYQLSRLPKMTDDLAELIVALDASALLAPLQASSMTLSGVEGVLRRMASNNRLFIPAHALREYSDNRWRVAMGASDQLKGARYSVKPRPGASSMSEMREYGKLKEAHAKLSQAAAEFNQSLGALREAAEIASINEVTGMYRRLYEKDQSVLVDIPVVHERMATDWLFRFRYKLPPGSEDSKDVNRIPGDLIIWHTLLFLGAATTKPMLFVSNDAKRDWVEIKKDDTQQARQQLRYEYFRWSRGKSFYVCTFDQFMSLFGAESEVVRELRFRREIDEALIFLNEGYDSYGNAAILRRSVVVNALVRHEERAHLKSTFNAFSANDMPRHVLFERRDEDGLMHGYSLDESYGWPLSGGEPHLPIYIEELGALVREGRYASVVIFVADYGEGDIDSIRERIDQIDPYANVEVRFVTIPEDDEVDEQGNTITPEVISIDAVVSRTAQAIADGGS